MAKIEIAQGNGTDGKEHGAGYRKSDAVPVQRTDWDMVAAFEQTKWQCKCLLKNLAEQGTIVLTA